MTNAQLKYVMMGGKIRHNLELTPPKTRLLMSKQDSLVLAEVIAQLLKNRDWRAAMSQNVLKHAQERFDTRKNVQRAEDVILQYCGYTFDEQELQEDALQFRTAGA